LGTHFIHSGETQSAVEIAHFLDDLHFSTDGDAIVVALMASFTRPTQIKNAEAIADEFPGLRRWTMLALFKGLFGAGEIESARSMISKIPDDLERIEADAMLVSLISDVNERRRAFDGLLDRSRDVFLPESRDWAFMTIARGEALSRDSAGVIRTSYLISNQDMRYACLASMLEVAKADRATITATIAKIENDSRGASPFQQLQMAQGKTGLAAVLVEELLAAGDFDSAAKIAEEQHGGARAAVALATYQATRNDVEHATQWLKLADYRQEDVAIRVATNCHRLHHDAEANAFFSKAKELALKSDVARNSALSDVGKCAIELGDVSSAEQLLGELNEAGTARWELIIEIAKAKASTDHKIAEAWANLLKSAEDRTAAHVGMVANAE